MPIKDLTKEDCEQWKLNKEKNPNNPKNPRGYVVKNGSKTYKDIDKHCAQFEQNYEPSAAAKVVKRQTWNEDFCRQWNENKDLDPDNPINPMDKKRVAVGSDKYDKINAKCDEIMGIKKRSPKPVNNKLLSRNLTLEDCIKWMKNKTKNPLSGYSLNEKSKILKEIQKQCKPLLDAYNAKSKSPLPQKKSPPKSSSKSSKSSTRSSSNSSKRSRISKSPVIQISRTINLHYPELDDEHFREKLTSLAEYYVYHVPAYDRIRSKEDFVKKSNDLCKDFEKTSYQYFISSYISSRTPYRGVLLYHGVGVGKTCSSITLAEGFLTSHSINEEAKIWVIMPLALKTSFKDQIFSLATDTSNFEQLAKQCTGDLYIKLAQVLREGNKENILKSKIKNLLKSRYKLFTYEGFATFIENEYIAKGKIVKDKVIIVDEAHNIRSMVGAAAANANGNLDEAAGTSSSASEKRVYTSLVQVAQTGVNNRFVLLSATPMYNQPEDIFDLLYLLCLNDKRDLLTQPFPTFFNSNDAPNTKTIELMQRLSVNYISYLRGRNPFTFASKLSPKYVPGLKFLTEELQRDSNNKPIKATYKGWLDNIADDGIVTSLLGEKQLEYITKNNAKSDDNNVFNNLQPMNIVYDNAIGDRGFNTMFTRNEGKRELNVRYNKNYDNALYPDEEHLGRYSGKFLNICNIIKNTTGIAVIYSGYIWSGIIPIAICLEHMGFQREGNNILNNPDVIEDAPRYGQNKAPKYCILSSENSEVMGNTSIDALMKIINNPKNIDGSMIKVILITPVAGEGLSFYNVREMHLVEPWFHFNKVTQIIGRGIRNCRHQDLPLEDRNVTVFLHASVYAENEKETTDIHAFRIASKKLIQSNAIDKVIRDSAVDCILMKNINYFPKTIFELGKIKIRTSQNIELDYMYGDNENDEPQCRLEDNHALITTGFRRDAYQPLIYAMQNKLKKMIAEAINSDPPSYYITFDEIMSRLQFNKTIIYDAIAASVYPNILVDGYILTPHNDGLHIINVSPDNKNKQSRLRLSFANVANANKTPSANRQDTQQPISKCNTNKLNVISAINDNLSAVLALYTYLSPECFEELVKKFIETAELSATDEIIANLLHQQGALIKNDELRSLGRREKYIGYVNIFNSNFEPVIFVDGSRYRDLVGREVDELLARRRRVVKPTNMAQEQMAWGIVTPVLDKKTGMYSNVFKILTAGSSIGNKTGIVCSSLQKPAQEKILSDLGNTNKYGTKAEYCHNIALQLMRMDRLSINPEWKPVI